MKFSKEQKAWLKREGYWKAVKRNTKAYAEEFARCFGEPVEKTNNTTELTGAFEWCTSPEGHVYWSDITRRMRYDLR